MKTRNNGSRIFLTELMFAILYFIIIAAICVECFAKSYNMSSQAKEKTNAVSLASNAAELFLGLDDYENFTTYYDEDWNETTEDEKYKVTGIVTDEGQMKNMSITVTKLSDDSVIYSLNVEKAIYLED